MNNASVSVAFCALSRIFLRFFIISGSSFLQGEIILSEMPPIRTVFPSMNIQGPLRDIKKYVSLANDVIDKASESLRLKRSKPLQQNVQTIDMCIKR